MGLRNPLLDPVLSRLGIRYVSWTRRGLDTLDRNPDTVLARLARKISAGDVLVLHDGGAARTPGGLPVVLSVLPALIERIEKMTLKPVS
jgi:hypothetical protein